MLMVQLLRGRGGYGSGRGGADINERAGGPRALSGGRTERVEAAREERRGEEERLQRSGRVRIATVGRRRSDGWDRSPGKLAVAPSGIRLRAGKGLGFLLRRVVELGLGKLWLCSSFLSGPGALLRQS
jgi:hypothetical protein